MDTLSLLSDIIVHELSMLLKVIMSSTLSSVKAVYYICVHSTEAIMFMF